MIAYIEKRFAWARGEKRFYIQYWFGSCIGNRERMDTFNDLLAICHASIFDATRADVVAVDTELIRKVDVVREIMQTDGGVETSDRRGAHHIVDVMMTYAEVQALCDREEQR